MSYKYFLFNIFLILCSGENSAMYTLQKKACKHASLCSAVTELFMFHGSLPFKRKLENIHCPGQYWDASDYWFLKFKFWQLYTFPEIFLIVCSFLCCVRNWWHSRRETAVSILETVVGITSKNAKSLSHPVSFSVGNHSVSVSTFSQS